jgi:hypothetical protein
MRKIQHHMIIFLLFAMLFSSGLTYFPIKQTFAQLQASTPTTSAQVGQSQFQQPSQSQQPGQFQDRVETGREPSLTPEAQPPTPQTDVAPPTPNQQRLQVSFTSIRINNDHDPNPFGVQNDGEWKIGVLVNGQFRNLSPPGSPLGDARGGRTYSLSNIEPVVLNIDKSSGALIVSTIGQELDGCNFNFKIPPAVQAAGNAVGKAVAAYYTGGASTKACDAAQGQCEKLHAATWNIQLKAAQGVVNKVCNIFTANDAIGLVTQKQFELKMYHPII